MPYPRRTSEGSHSASPSEIGRAAWRGREWVSGVAVSLKKKRAHEIPPRDWISDVCSPDLPRVAAALVELDAVPAAPLGVEPLREPLGDRESGVEGKRVGFGGRRILKKKEGTRDTPS